MGFVNGQLAHGNAPQPTTEIPAFKTMNDEQRQFYMILQEAPARLTPRQAAWLLNLQEHDIPVLVSANLLRPLGNPGQNCVKYFATISMRELARDAAWLGKATNAVLKHWREKNARRKGSEAVNS